MIESLRQVQVVSALARLAGNGGWARILAGRELDEALDVADAQLLEAASVLRRRGPGRWEPVDLHPWYDDPEVLATGLVAELRRAVRHGLDDDGALALDAGEIEAMGMASRSVAGILADAVLPMLPVTREALASGTARFLDVGVGTGAISETLCREFPGTLAVGIDVSDEVLAMAKEQLVGSPVAEQIELRQQSVVDLREVEAYDLAWLPQVFVSRDDLDQGLVRVHAALRPGCWLVMPVAANASDCSDLDRAGLELDAAIRGGGSMSVAVATQLLTRAGFAEVRDMTGVSQSLVMAQKA